MRARGRPRGPVRPPAADELIDADGVRAKFGVSPESIPDFLALVGDSADGYPGIPGWGKVSAGPLLTRYGHLEDIPERVSAWDVSVRGGATLAASLRDHRDEAFLFRELATLTTDVPLPETLDDLRWKGAHRAAFTAWPSGWAPPGWSTASPLGRLSSARARPSRPGWGWSRPCPRREAGSAARRADAAPRRPRDGPHSAPRRIGDRAPPPSPVDERVAQPARVLEAATPLAPAHVDVDPRTRPGPVLEHVHDLVVVPAHGRAHRADETEDLRCLAAAKRLISPPSDEPRVPVPARSVRVGNDRSTSGLTALEQPVEIDRRPCRQPDAAGDRLVRARGCTHPCASSPALGIANRDRLDPILGQSVQRFVGVPLADVGSLVVEHVLAVVEVDDRVAPIRRPDPSASDGGT